MGICLGAYAENDKSVLLYVPGKRFKEFPRMNVQTLKVNFPPHPKTMDVQPVYDALLQVEYKSPITRHTQLLGTHGFQHFSQILDDMDDKDLFPPSPPCPSTSSSSSAVT
jgi:hypothetical protein